MSAKVEIYTWTTCPFCVRAKSLLKNKSVDFIEYNIDGDEIARNEMSKRANGKRSVPQ
ncbi:MAG: glutaredoxin, partial [Dolichospermum sp.]|nr:glutaredoxin [Dolichospermum sp.]